MHRGAVRQARLAGALVRIGREIGQAVERQVDFERGSFDAKVLYRSAEILVEMAALDEAQKRAFRVGVRDHNFSVDLLAVLERDAVGFAVFDQDVFDLGVRADHRALRFGGTRQGVADGAHPSADESPQAARARRPAHYVMQQDVGSARRRRPAVGPDHAVSRQRRLNLLRFKTLFEEIAYALSHDLDHSRYAFVAEFESPQTELA